MTCLPELSATSKLKAISCPSLRSRTARHWPLRKAGADDASLTGVGADNTAGAGAGADEPANAASRSKGKRGNGRNNMVICIKLKAQFNEKPGISLAK